MAFDRMTADLRAELTAEAGGRAEAGAVARMTEERAALESRIEALQADTAMRDEAKAHQAAGLSRCYVEAAARNTLPEKLAELEARAERPGSSARDELAVLRRPNRIWPDSIRTLPERFLAVEGARRFHRAGLYRAPDRTGCARCDGRGSIPPPRLAHQAAATGFRVRGPDAPTSFVDHVRRPSAR